MVSTKAKATRGSAVKKAVADAATPEPTPQGRHVSKRAGTAKVEDADNLAEELAPVEPKKESGSKRKQKHEAVDEPRPDTRKKAKIVLKAALDPHAAKIVTIIDNQMPVVSSVEPAGVSIEDIPDIADLVMDAPKTGARQLTGLPKSGRDWKPMQKMRFSSQFRAGTVFNLSKTQQYHAAERARKAQVKELERELNKERKDKEAFALEKRKEQSARRAKNQYNANQVQSINPAKLKKMSKKQLRMVSKTVMGKNGQIELVPAYK